MKKQPSIFVGHGSPMNAIAVNSYSKMLNQLGLDLEKNFGLPKAILCISAHWQTDGTQVCDAANPETIHDFYGFPKELFQVQYPAPGSPELADFIANNLHGLSSDGKQTSIRKTSQWGLDHGAWSVLIHLFPKANIPVVQLSLDKNLDGQGHLKLAGRLQSLRSQGFLILGSGNITHNLGDIDWSQNAQPAKWALSFDEMIRDALVNNKTDVLTQKSPDTDPQQWRHAHPTLEHFNPLLYVVGASDEMDQLSFPFSELELGTLSMRTVLYANN